MSRLTQTEKMPEVPGIENFTKTKTVNRVEYTHGPYLIWQNSGEDGWHADIIMIGEGRYQRKKISDGIKTPSLAIDQIRTYARSANLFQEEKSSQEIKEEEKLEKMERELSEYVNTHSVKTMKYDFIICPVCRSSLKRKLLTSNKCPLCRADMRSKSVVDEIERKLFRIEEQKNVIRQLRAERTT